MRLLTWVLYVALWAALVVATQFQHPLLPTEDEFYVPPPGFEAESPGTILRIRPTPNKLRNIYFAIDVDQLWQLMVRLTDQFGMPSAVVTSVIIPFNADPTKIVLYQMFVDLCSEECAPLIAMLEGALMATLSSQLEVLFIQLCLEKGWPVVVPDHGGVENQFPGGPQGAYATLDSIRGVLALGATTNILSEAQVVMWGYLGGSIPTIWALALQPKYAPELKTNLIGTIAGGVITNLSSAAWQNDGTPFAGIIAIAMGGYAKTYPQFDALLKQNMSPKHYHRFISLQTGCFFPNVMKFVGVQFFLGKKPWIKDGWDFLNNEVCKQIFAENLMPLDDEGPMPETPVLIYHGYHDELLPHKDCALLVDLWCRRGIKSLEFLSDYTSDHMIGVVLGVPLAITWMSDRFAGKPPVEGCVKLNKLSFMRYPGAMRETLELLKRTGGHYLGRNVGLATNVLIDAVKRFIRYGVDHGKGAAHKASRRMLDWYYER